MPKRISTPLGPHPKPSSFNFDFNLRQGHINDSVVLELRFKSPRLGVLTLDPLIAKEPIVAKTRADHAYTFTLSGNGPG